MLLLQIMSLIFGCLIILLLVVERSRRRYFKLVYDLRLLRETTKKLHKDAEDIFGIYEGVRDIATTMNMEDILKIMSQMMRKYFEFSFSKLCLFTEDEGNMSTAIQYDFVLNLLLNDRVEVTDKNILNVIANKRPIVSPDEKRIQEYIDDGEEKPEIFIMVPLIAEDKVIGTIEMRREREPYLPFSYDDLLKLTNLCAQTSIILRRAKLYGEVERLAIVDGLTGLYVHRYFQEKLAIEAKRAKTYNEVFSLLMADIDFFKKYNDQYGHQAGDELLRRVSKILKEGVRETDIAVRYGGEEFVIILLHRGKDETRALAEELRKKVETLKLEIEGGFTGVTISLGHATYPDDSTSIDELIKHADEALYRAKEGGRNQTVAYGKK
ncbi:hypothetical protein COY52_00645 [Candidatus Desantisbacteria bacterium CG_4_10_14_0_8_um_filter_48_22]|uniref:GGDEF domain-containing protein n=1 Tax=Candidatus Desantisbacteria bacterium CG_4_10_14_0_8_um_filter_48_22 TaxID=1974543 RepID=A0A2M7SFD0_9BACT|nr:MAG: hypothetical protein AUJ67_10400 [Candidatus Desantisbacteria bacterium CG1_02_49_89]PIV55092.1 MAG: hypothetical protein COS16_08440 [Candidatus Desantisbacteria bacterium CG02_land_8_20_14_3_00_49_13]PIZ18200.1 MAG: hypothetical protein COY52_00645 [Candidatus Desantisbacteria bacterium CG_4_10_14_0_8_um_filter_48_22]PJB28725.1 MAG: hypothetical protein CO111_00855 [Candidatus Desantisbacteria bacterium CG_4_9_14_3_um_filter_50_7]